MRNLTYILALLSTALLAPINFELKAEEPRKLSIPIVAKLSAATVVKVWGAGSSGSGVVVEMPEEDGTGTKKVIFTAYHVVSKLGKNEYIEIELPSNKFIQIPSTSISKVKGLDLAILRLPKNLAKANTLKSVSVGNSNALMLGQSIIIAGYPIKSSTNSSNKVRIKPGVIQTFSEKNNTTSLVGYDAKTVPGMSGGGVFSMDGKLLLIHLKGEKDLWETDINVDGRPLKSGTNYGIPALLALKEVQRQTLSNFNVETPLDEFRKGLYLVQNNRIKDAYDVFNNLWMKYPDSLIAEWNTACMKLVLKYPNGAPRLDDEAETNVYLRYSAEKSRSIDDFYNKHKINPVYGIPFTSDSIIWDQHERQILLSFDPLYAMANPADTFHLAINRGSLVRLNIYHDRCERIVGLKNYTGPNGTQTYWEPIPN